MANSPVLQTARLTLRPFSVNDADELFFIRGDPDAMRYWDWPPDRDQAATRAISQMLVEEMAGGSALYWTARTASGGFVGVFDLSELSGEEPDLGFMVVRFLWGRGFGFEAASAVVSEAWRRGIPGLKARIHDGNERSARLLTKLGFNEIGGARPMEVRPGVTILCRHFRLPRPDHAGVTERVGPR
jgi:[ribosomal protein S5]-alanine N-acetyltransferase